MTSKAALVEMGVDPNHTLDEHLIVTGVFIALDINNTGMPEGEMHLAGTFLGWVGDWTPILILDLPENRGKLNIPLRSIVKAYWAPAGYRPSS